MPKRRVTIEIPSLNLEGKPGSLVMRLAQALREAIARGELRSGERLPSTRALAASLGISRGTVVEVFEQLLAEGFLDTAVGSGTRVADLADTSSWAPTLSEAIVAPDATGFELPAAAVRLEAAAAAMEPHAAVPFAVAVPAGGVEPDERWRQLGNRLRRSGRAGPSSYSDPQGLPELREAIADHVRRARAVRCEPDQVIVTSGTQQGLYMAGRVLLSRGDAVWAEDPAYPGLTAVLDDQELEVHRVSVDEQGIDVARGVRDCPTARAAFVTPSHQYPLGMPLSMARRQALVGWAQERRAWIVEDDYDSELRYAGHPFPSMQGLCPQRVVYLGTFSKMLFPSLRLGYVISPEPLVRAFAGARAILDRHSPTADQCVLAAYMKDGGLEGHIRRIRSLYAERRSLLLGALEGLPEGCRLQPSDQGMHVLLWLPSDADDVEVARHARVAGIAVRPISPMYASRGRPGLMLGFGGFPREQLEQSARVLQDILRAQGR